jgi:hypothetical protein
MVKDERNEDSRQHEIKRAKLDVEDRLKTVVYAITGCEYEVIGNISGLIRTPDEQLGSADFYIMRTTKDGQKIGCFGIGADQSIDVHIQGANNIVFQVPVKDELGVQVAQEYERRYDQKDTITVRNKKDPYGPEAIYKRRLSLGIPSR